MLNKIKNGMLNLLDVWFSNEGKIGRVAYSISILFLFLLYFIVDKYVKEYVHILLFVMLGLDIFFIVMQKRCYDIGWKPKKYLLLFSVAIITSSCYHYFIDTKFIAIYFVVTFFPVFGAIIANFVLMFSKSKISDTKLMGVASINNITRLIVVVVVSIGMMTSFLK